MVERSIGSGIEVDKPLMEGRPLTCGCFFALEVTIGESRGANREWNVIGSYFMEMYPMRQLNEVPVPFAR